MPLALCSTASCTMTTFYLKNTYLLESLGFSLTPQEFAIPRQSNLENAELNAASRGNHQMNDSWWINMLLPQLFVGQFWNVTYPVPPVGWSLSWKPTHCKTLYCVPPFWSHCPHILTCAQAFLGWDMGLTQEWKMTIVQDTKANRNVCKIHCEISLSTLSFDMTIITAGINQRLTFAWGFIFFL